MIIGEFSRVTEIIKRLKDTGMLLRDIKHYSDLRYQGEATIEERMDLLIRHRETVFEEQKKLLPCNRKVELKEFYNWRKK